MRLATGMTLLLKLKARADRSTAMISNGRMNRSNPMPADFIATNSKVSPRFPNVMIDDSKTASGNANGTSVALR